MSVGSLHWVQKNCEMMGNEGGGRDDLQQRSLAGFKALVLHGQIINP